MPRRRSVRRDRCRSHRRDTGGLVRMVHERHDHEAAAADLGTEDRRRHGAAEPDASRRAGEVAFGEQIDGMDGLVQPRRGREQRIEVTQVAPGGDDRLAFVRRTRGRDQYRFAGVGKNLDCVADRSRSDLSANAIASLISLFLGIAVLRAIGVVGRRVGAGVMQFRLQATYRRRTGLKRNSGK